MNRFRRLFFNLWYFRNAPWDTGISPPELFDFIASQPPGRALDMGCGSGTNVITLATLGWQATGVDFAWRAIQLARRKARQAGISADFHVDSVTRLGNIHGPFDLILDLGCFHSLSPADRQVYLQNIFHLLVPGGSLLLYVFFKQNPEEKGPGVCERDIELISTCLDLIQRSDGSERGLRPSAWLTFQKQ